jgi:hypothetical protein
MAIENAKTLNVRIRNKYDSYENWSKSSLVLEAGEIAIAYSTVDVTVGEGKATQPVLLMKVGNGEKTFADLPWLSARAADVLEACKTTAGLTAFVNNVIATADMATNEKFTELANKVETLNGDEETAGSVAKAIKDAIDALKLDETYVAQEEGKSLIADTEIARLEAMSDGANKVEKSETNGNIKIDGQEVIVYTHPDKHAIADVTGLQDALNGKQAAGDYAAEEHTHTKAEITDFAHTHTVAEITDFDEKVKAYDYATKSEAKGYADAKVASVSAADASLTVAGTSTAPTVAVKLDPSADNALKLNENGLKVEIGAAPEYSIVKAADSGDYAAVYNLTKDGTIVGASINIPKDMVVKSGSVVGDEIVLVLNDEAATEIKIPVASLIEYVTSGSQAGDMIIVNVSDDHKVTATITDGTITLAKLTTEVQTAIGKAHSHENETVLAGITADKVQAWDGAVTNEHTHTFVESELNLIQAGDVAKWNGAQAAAEATAAAALAKAKTELEAAIEAAKTDASNKDAVVLAEAQKGIAAVETALGARIEALEGTDHEHANADELALIATGDVAKWNAAEGKAHEHENKELLDTYTQTEENLADAVAKKHEHENAEELAKFVDGDKDKLDTAVQTVTAAADSGLKATKTGTDVKIEINDTITWIFDCGGASV